MRTESTTEIAGRSVLFRVIDGTIIDTAARSDTYVSGGGSVSNGSGNVSVSSSVVVSNDFWVRFEGGERHYTISGNVIALRSGSRVRIVEASLPHGASSLMCYRNNDTGEVQQVGPGWTETDFTRYMKCCARHFLDAGKPGRVGTWLVTSIFLAYLVSMAVLVAKMETNPGLSGGPPWNVLWTVGPFLTGILFSLALLWEYRVVLPRARRARKICRALMDRANEALVS